MEDYIFLIIAVVISIFASINKNKKKSAEKIPAIESNEDSGDSFIDQFFDLDFPDEEETIPVKAAPAEKKVPLVAPTPIRTQMSHVSTFKSSLPERSGRIVQKIKKREFLNESEPEIETDETSEYLSNFSLRQAFVYSEILNPKYLNESSGI
jgi:hypothetical protein